jgi:methyl-accepting chemotaxis protein-2 (aspartate sensor receptor)
MLVWVLAIGLLTVAYAERSHAAAQPADKLDATIFSFDGTDFIRTKTTLVTADGKSAANTKLDHETAAYKALKDKHSYVGEVTVFGHKYDADYAPLVGDDGKLTGALFVAVPK